MVAAVFPRFPEIRLIARGTVSANSPIKSALASYDIAGVGFADRFRIGTVTHREGTPVQGTLVDAPEVAREVQPGSRLRNAIHAGRQALLARQRPDGHWCGELQGDTILESEYLLLLAFLGKLDDPAVPKLASYIRAQQLPAGAWSNYADGPPDVSVSVKAYFALKLAGDSAGEPHMRRAAEIIRELGGAEAVNSFSRFYLALLGQTHYSNCPAVPPEMILLPRWSKFNIYNMSSWTRTIVVPLSLVYAFKSVTEVPVKSGIAELFVGEPFAQHPPAKATAKWLSWTNLFLAADRWYKKLEWALGPIRRRAVSNAVAWMRAHYEDSDGLGAIFPPMIYNVIVLRCLDVPDGDPEMQWAMKQLDDLKIEEGEALRLQPCVSPVWDTALTTIALADAGLTPDTPAVSKAVCWMLDKEVRRPGDWSLSHRHIEPAGWFFEYRNGQYPDTDDTAMVLMALARSKQHSMGRPKAHGLFTDENANTAEAATARAIKWLLALQNKDGGWAAFDRGVTWDVLTRVPFADHNAMLDPSCPDITARVLESLGHFGYRPGHHTVDRAIKFLRRTQEPDSGWPGRWGVNYLYGTWQVLQGLRAIGFDMGDAMVRRAVAWLHRVQQPSGAWGESCASYDDPTQAGVGEPTASQTAWALLGLVAAGEADSDEVKAGVSWLLDTQSQDGVWSEEPFTGTGFPKVFYLKYHYYPIYFPVMALSRYANASSKRSEPAGSI
jgi:squalene-hopene/tetraprenyl-beta-curcumene cyclase